MQPSTTPESSWPELGQLPVYLKEETTLFPLSSAGCILPPLLPKDTEQGLLLTAPWSISCRSLPQGWKAARRTPPARVCLTASAVNSCSASTPGDKAKTFTVNRREKR